MYNSTEQAKYETAAMSTWKWKSNRQRARSAAERIIRTQNLNETLMNQVEARSSRGIFPNVRGMWEYRPGCSRQRYEQQMPDMLRCRPSSSIPAEEFLPLRFRFLPDSLPGAYQSARGIRSTPPKIVVLRRSFAVVSLPLRYSRREDVCHS